MLKVVTLSRYCRRWVIKPAFLLFALLLTLPSSVFAQAFIFTEEIPLNFGEMVITSNASVSSTTLARNGAVTNSGSIFLITEGTPGEYTISDTTPYVALNLSITLPVDSSSTFPGTEQLRLSAVDIPAVVTPDGSGSVTFRIGGTIQTSGNGGPYLNPATYPFIIDLEVTY